MAATSQWFGQSAGGLIANLWTANALSVMLMKSTYSPNIDTQLVYSDVSAQELAAGGGYTVGGQALASKTKTYTAATDTWDLDAADLTWGPGATFTTRYGIIYDNSGTKPLWALLDFGADQPISNGIFVIDWTSGLLQIVVGPPV